MRVLSAPLFPLRSVSKDTPAKDSFGPEALLNAFTQPKEYFGLLRNPNKDPPKEVLTAWACVCKFSSASTAQASCRMPAHEHTSR